MSHDPLKEAFEAYLALPNRPFRYPPNLVQKAVDAVQESSIASVSKRIGISVKTLCLWHHRAVHSRSDDTQKFVPLELGSTAFKKQPPVQKDSQGLSLSLKSKAGFEATVQGLEMRDLLGLLEGLKMTGGEV